VRATYFNQQSLAQLQDQQRFAMTVLTDVIQAGGYFPDPLGMTAGTALPAAGAYQVGQVFTGTQGATDTIGVRYRTANGDGVILCDGAATPPSLRGASSTPTCSPSYPLRAPCPESCDARLRSAPPPTPR